MERFKQHSGYIEFGEFCEERTPTTLSTHDTIDDNFVDSMHKEMDKRWLANGRYVDYRPHLEDSIPVRVQNNADPNNAGLRINIGLSVEMIRNGLVDTDYYLQRLRLKGKNRGGFYRKKGEKLHKTFYKHTKILKKLDFINHEKVNSYRKASLKYSPTQIWVTAPLYAFKNKKTYKAFLLAAIETYLLQGNYKNQHEGINKLDVVNDVWYNKQYDKPPGYEVSVKKFNNNIPIYKGQVSDTLIADFLSRYSHFSISPRTIQSWRSTVKFNTYTVLKYYIPVNGKKLGSSFKGRKTFYSAKTKKVYITHVVRTIHTCINMYKLGHLNKVYYNKLKLKGFNKLVHINKSRLKSKVKNGDCKEPSRLFDNKLQKEYSNYSFELEEGLNSF